MLTREEQQKRRRIFFTLCAKFPQLLSRNYMENALLLGDWLQVADPVVEFGNNGYYCQELTRCFCVQVRCNITAADEVSEALLKAMIENDRRSHSSNSSEPQATVEQQL